jgi:hypothetical protein
MPETRDRVEPNRGPVGERSEKVDRHEVPEIPVLLPDLDIRNHPPYLLKRNLACKG